MQSILWSWIGSHTTMASIWASETVISIVFMFLSGLECSVIYFSFYFLNFLRWVGIDLSGLLKNIVPSLRICSSTVVHNFFYISDKNSLFVFICSISWRLTATLFRSSGRCWRGRWSSTGTVWTRRPCGRSTSSPASRRRSASYSAWCPAARATTLHQRYLLSWFFNHVQSNWTSLGCILLLFLVLPCLLEEAAPYFIHCFLINFVVVV